MERVMITADEVVALAFGGDAYLDKKKISESVIRAAQRKFVRPVLGAVCDMTTRPYTTFLDEWVKPALAHYVKWLLLPELLVEVGASGVVVRSCEEYVGAGPEELRLLMQRVRSEADALMDRAVEELDKTPTLYPAYAPNENVRRRTRIVGGVVI